MPVAEGNGDKASDVVYMMPCGVDESECMVREWEHDSDVSTHVPGYCSKKVIYRCQSDDVAPCADLVRLDSGSTEYVRARCRWPFLRWDAVVWLQAWVRAIRPAMRVKCDDSVRSLFASPALVKQMLT